MIHILATTFTYTMRIMMRSIPKVSCADSAVTMSAMSAMSAQSVRRRTEPNVQMMCPSGNETWGNLGF